MKHLFRPTAVLVLCLFALFLVPRNTPQKWGKQKTLDMLSNRLLGLDQESAEYRETWDRLQKLLGRRQQKSQATENPALLLQAFRDIKTGPDGRSYPPSYRHKELKKAFSGKTRSKALDWVERGPNNVSGRTRAMLVDPDFPNTWFAATVGGGVWKTVNGGLSWRNNTPDLATLSTTCIAMAPSNHNVLYVGTGMGYGRTVDLAGSGVWKSVDRGESWFQLASTANGELLAGINRIYVDPLDENTVMACGNGDFTLLGPNGGERPSGIFRSEDGGDSWIQVFDPEPVFGPETDNRVQQIIGDPNDRTKVYASVNEVGVIRSVDGGKNWTGLGG